ncbi:MAG: hypothetical protein [Caudoviricetes sp.]|nr:MAG: hypothetical protein [Caudoviricetes sp.]
MAEVEKVEDQLKSNLLKLEKLRQEFLRSCNMKLEQKEVNELDNKLGYLVGDFCNLIIDNNKICKELIKCDSSFDEKKDGIKFVNNRKKHQRLSVVITENPVQNFVLDRSKLDSGDKILGGDVKWSESLLNSKGESKKDKQKRSFDKYFREKSVFVFIDTLIELYKLCLSNYAILNID